MNTMSEIPYAWREKERKSVHSMYAGDLTALSCIILIIVVFINDKNMVFHEIRFHLTL